MLDYVYLQCRLDLNQTVCVLIFGTHDLDSELYMFVICIGLCLVSWYAILKAPRLSDRQFRLGIWYLFFNSSDLTKVYNYVHDEILTCQIWSSELISELCRQSAAVNLVIRALFCRAKGEALARRGIQQLLATICCGVVNARLIWLWNLFLVLSIPSLNQSLVTFIFGCFFGVSVLKQDGTILFGPAIYRISIGSFGMKGFSPKWCTEGKEGHSL